MGDILDQLLSDPDTETGFSLVAGGSLRIDELPEHRIELHVFETSDAAGAFVSGLTLAGNKNSLAWTWQPKTRDSNRAVIVARLDQARPAGDSLAEIVPVIAHDEAQYDRDERQSSLKRIEERDRQWHAQVEAKTQSLRTALEAAGHSVTQYGANWVRTGYQTFSIEDGVYTARCGDQHEGSDHEVRFRYGEAAAAAGVAYDPEEHDFSAGPFDGPQEAAASVNRLREAVQLAKEMRKAAWHAAFVASMKITASRRRFLTAAAEGGISITYHRAQLRAYAGNEIVGPSEFQKLVKVGWIREDSRHSANITAEGLNVLASAVRKQAA